MIETVSNFKELHEHVKTCGLSFRDAVVDYYRVLGERLGFTVRKDASVIEYGLNFGKVSLIWVEPNTVFCLEFGGSEEILKHLWRVLEHKPDKAVFILSSGSQCKPDYVEKIVRNSYLLSECRDRIIVLDVSEKKVVYPRP
jgi:predicted glycoside hydrolase/deacetylase ChbG (UPF0249 family)